MKKIMSSSLNQTDAEYMQQIGIATYLSSRAPKYQFFQISCLRLWIEPAIQHRQISFFYDSFGLPIGYISLAFISDDTAARLINDEIFLLHESEWNEGDNYWIIDFVAPFGHALKILQEFRRKFVGGNFELNYLSRSKNNIFRPHRKVLFKNE